MRADAAVSGQGFVSPLTLPTPSASGPSLSRKGRGVSISAGGKSPLPLREREGPAAKPWEGEGSAESTEGDIRGAG